MDIETRLAAHAADLDAAGIAAGPKHAFRRLLMDTAAVMVAACADADCTRIVDSMLAWGGTGACSVVGRPARAAPAAAALANGARAHWFEWDDTHDASHVHASATIFPALVAAAEEMANRGRPTDPADFLAATVAAFDIACGVGRQLKEQGHIGWMPTGTGGVIGAAAGVGRLLDLDRAGIRSAMGLAAVQSGYLRQGLAASVNSKNLLCGLGAKLAVESALLAEAGVAGPGNFYTGTYGLHAVHASGDGDPAEVLAYIDGPPAIKDVSLKPYPCCRSSHPAVDGALDLLDANPGLAAEATAILVTAPRGVCERVGGRFVAGDDARLAAQFNLSYTLAVVFTNGALNQRDFGAPTVVRNAHDLAALIERVDVEAVDSTGGDANAMLPVTVRVETRDGGVSERLVETLKGSPDRPLSATEEATKWNTAMAGLLSQADQQALRASILEAGMPDIDTVMETLRGASGTAG